MLFKPGNEIIVITRGPGHLSLLSYGSTDGGKDLIGSMNTDTTGITRWLISFSHHYDKFAFIWDGQAPCARPFIMSNQTGEAKKAPSQWSSYMTEIYLSRKPPQPLGTVDHEEIERRAKEKLKDYPENFMYVGGNAGIHQTFRANRRAYEKFGIIPRMLVDSTVRDLSVTLFGKTYSSPILMSPIGCQTLFHPEGEEASARAAGKLGIPFTISTASTRSLEEVAAANGNGERWYQFYWPSSEDFTASLLNRAKAAGYTTLVCTVDTVEVGWHAHDISKAFFPYRHGFGTQIASSDPLFMARYGFEAIRNTSLEYPYQAKVMDQKIEQGDEEAKKLALIGMEFAKECTGNFHTWEGFRALKKQWGGPLIIKGIQHVADVEKAIDYDLDGVVISTHGMRRRGRQLDGSVPALYALERIMKSPKVRAAQQSGKLTVLYDSGIRTGPDIFKALALGAQAVLLARPWLFGMILGGEAGVEQVIRHTLADLDITMANAGYPRISDFQGKGEEVLMKLDF